MPRNPLLLLMVWLIAAQPVQAAVADGESCNGAGARDFDFWIGDWDIRQRIRAADGGWIDLPAQTSVAVTLGGCALIEHWSGRVQFFWEDMRRPEPMQGLSLRTYDPERGVWQIHWMDSRRPRFDAPYVGAFEGDEGIFYRETQGPQGRQIGRIRFVDITGTSVRWDLSVSDGETNDWTTLWIMDMTRRPP
jgi:hypothetical protein